MIKLQKTYFLLKYTVTLYTFNFFGFDNVFVLFAMA